jgi:peptidoglycan/LPS O-acetylase OafA/YrhL
MNGVRQLNIGPFQSDLLDLSRWLAAFLVVAEHLRSLLFADHGQPGALGGAGWKVFYFFTHFGHFAVMIFFVMSGFLVGGKVLERLVQGNFTWQKYAVDRISRLYAVYLLALLIGGALDSLGYFHFNDFGLYDRTSPGRIASASWNYHATLSVQTLGVNVIMCQTILGPVFGSNGPLWSLANEAWYYVLGPLAFVLVFGRETVRWWLGLVALAAVLWFLPGPIRLYALIWLLGALLYFINHRRLVPLWLALMLLGTALTIARMEWFGNAVVQDFLIGLSFALVINSATGRVRRLAGHRWSRGAANFSYSVYLCHFPFLVFVYSVLFHLGIVRYPGVAVPKYVVLYALLLVLTIAWCYLISLATERQTPRIRTWLTQQLIRKPQIVSPSVSTPVPRPPDLT